MNTSYLYNHLTSNNNFFLFAGPCAIESKSLLIEVAEHLIPICKKLDIPFVLKGSFKKANRSKLSSFTGIGDEKALDYLKTVGQTYQVPTITDVHSAEDCKLAAKYVDVLQIPAFLCRQSDLLVAAAKTGKIVNIKKGQFLSPQSMIFAIEKIKNSNNPHYMVTERGTTFGYQDLVIDFRSAKIMNQFAPTVLDITHSLQQPNQSSGVTNGVPEFIEPIAKAGIAAGFTGIFMETHPNPKEAKSDSTNMIKLSETKNLLEQLTKIKQVL